MERGEKENRNTRDIWIDREVSEKRERGYKKRGGDTEREKRERIQMKRRGRAGRNGEK